MAVVTISRQYASGGSPIAQKTAEQLGWTLVDNQFIDLVAERAGWTAEEVKNHEERGEGLVDRLAKTLSAATPETFLAAGEHPYLFSNQTEIHTITQAVITEVAQRGDAVLVGRGAQAFLRDRHDAMHVFVVGPHDVRVRSAMETQGFSEKDARREVDRIDHQRREYVRTHYRREWDDPSNYHLVVNSGLWSYDECADAITAAARRTLTPSTQTERE